MARRGPKPKAGGDRGQVLARVPAADAQFYRQEAASVGLPLSDWVAWTLATATGRPAPDYVAAALAKRHAQPELTVFAEAC